MLFKDIIEIMIIYKKKGPDIPTGKSPRKKMQRRGP
jgi:hypothetical protein